MSLPNMSETSRVELDRVVQRVMAGEEQAFDELVLMTQVLVRKIAIPLLPATAVDDAVQDTYVLVFQKLQHLREAAVFRGWLSRIALHVCYEWHRKHQPRIELKVEQAVSQLGDTKLELRSALEQLKKNERDILILREYLGLSFEEIADATLLSAGAVRSRHHHACRKLKGGL